MNAEHATTKTCNKCLAVKDLSLFRARKKNNDGRGSTCKECLSISDRKYREKHSEKIGQYYKENKQKVNAKQKEYYKKNAEYIKSKSANYYSNNKDTALASQKRYAEKNKERISSYQRQKYLNNRSSVIKKAKEYARNNSEKVAEYQKKWKAENQEKIKAWSDANPDYFNEKAKQWAIDNPSQSRANSANRRAAKMNALAAWADQSIIEKMYSESRRLMELTGIKFAIDHVIPLQGDIVTGLHVETNLQILTAYENGSKNNRITEKELDLIAGQITANNGCRVVAAA